MTHRSLSATNATRLPSGDSTGEKMPRAGRVQAVVLVAPRRAIERELRAERNLAQAAAVRVAHADLAVRRVNEAPVRQEADREREDVLSGRDRAAVQDDL